MSIFFTSDLHINHKNILKFCPTSRPFQNVTEMNEEIVKRHNSKVTPDDETYFLGDLAMGCSAGYLGSILGRMNGRKYLVLGNHDSQLYRKEQSRTILEANFEWIKHYHELKVNKNHYVLFHFPIEIWHKRHWNSYMLHGHCIDLETEILTEEGWKCRSNIKIFDKCYSYNHNTKLLELDTVLDVIDQEINGEVFEFNGKSINTRVTNNHTMIRFTSSGRLVEEPASSFFDRKTCLLLRAGLYPSTGLDLNENLLRLYILLVADANEPLHTDLVRYRVSKQRKLNYCREVLYKLGIDYKELPQKDGLMSINFYLPSPLKPLNVKGMDIKLLSCNQKQFEVILETYKFSDGCENGKGVIVYSNKKDEIDLLQALAVKCGYGATSYSRYHGFSNTLGHQLSIYPASFQMLQDVNKRVEKQRVKNEHFWCIKNINQNFLCRRRGKVHLTGNCHSNFPRRKGYLRMDVGVDTNNCYPYSLEEIDAIMDSLFDGKSPNHH